MRTTQTPKSNRPRDLRSSIDREFLTFEQYGITAAKTDRFFGTSPDNHYRELSFGLFGEVGGLLSALKKGRRDQLSQPESQAVKEELGDALWYLVNLAKLSGVSAERLGSAGLSFLRAAFHESPKAHPSNLTFRALEGITSYQHAALAKTNALPLRQLAKASGKVVDEPLGSILGLDEDARAAFFGEVLGLLAMVSEIYRQTLTEIASANLAKIADRWPWNKTAHRVLPVHGEPHEQFPQRMSIQFIERKIGNRLVVVQQLQKLNIGDPLTDNSHRPDGYRYHDVFHLSYAVHLGWSPVLRALLKLKRKSDPKIDENEDGARAIILEEGVATWIFNHAKGRRLYAGVEEGRLSYAILKQVRAMLDGLQVAETSLWQWERAILDGFKVFRQLLENRGGTVMADLAKHTLTYIPQIKAEQEQ
jgi:NTP pyrophosphatase (non-canonical NTP hydrolase)